MFDPRDLISASKQWSIWCWLHLQTELNQTDPNWGTLHQRKLLLTCAGWEKSTVLLTWGLTPLAQRFEANQTKLIEHQDIHICSEQPGFPSMHLLGNIALLCCSSLVLWTIIRGSASTPGGTIFHHDIILRIPIIPLLKVLLRTRIIFWKIARHNT